MYVRYLILFELSPFCFPSNEITHSHLPFANRFIFVFGGVGDHYTQTLTVYGQNVEYPTLINPPSTLPETWSLSKKSGRKRVVKVDEESANHHRDEWHVQIKTIRGVRMKCLYVSSSLVSRRQTKTRSLPVDCASPRKPRIIISTHDDFDYAKAQASMEYMRF